MNSKENKHFNTTLKINNNLISGLFSGAFCAGLFNPWDRALYLSIKCNRPFLLHVNFNAPYQGLSQSLIQRAFLSGIYYAIQGELNTYMLPYLRNHFNLSDTTSQFCIGLTAGGASGLLTNSISAVKYHTWGEENHSFSSSVREMYQLGRIKSFTKGTVATMNRDIVFGSTYEVIRHLLHPSHRFKKGGYQEGLSNATAAGIATIASGPFNYARNIQYATPPNQKPPPILKTIKSLCNEAMKCNHQPFSRVRFFQQRFRIGWGTARVAVGMAVGQRIFDASKNFLTNYDANKTSATSFSTSDLETNPSCASFNSKPAAK